MPYYTRDPKRDQNSANHPNVPERPLMAGMVMALGEKYGPLIGAIRPFRNSRDPQGYIWVVLKIMGQFWVYFILSRGTKMGP